ncbi:MAG: hypothetical protein AAF380_01525, partial [Bacteroidota bacterium]
MIMSTSFKRKSISFLLHLSLVYLAMPFHGVIQAAEADGNVSAASAAASANGAEDANKKDEKEASNDAADPELDTMFNNLQNLGKGLQAGAVDVNDEDGELIEKQVSLNKRAEQTFFLVYPFKEKKGFYNSKSLRALQLFDENIKTIINLNEGNDDSDLVFNLENLCLKLGETTNDFDSKLGEEHLRLEFKLEDQDKNEHIFQIKEVKKKTQVYEDESDSQEKEANGYGFAIDIMEMEGENKKSVKQFFAFSIPIADEVYQDQKLDDEISTSLAYDALQICMEDSIYGKKRDGLISTFIGKEPRIKLDHTPKEVLEHAEQNKEYAKAKENKENGKQTFYAVKGEKKRGLMVKTTMQVKHKIYNEANLKSVYSSKPIDYDAKKFASLTIFQDRLAKQFSHVEDEAVSVFSTPATSPAPPQDPNKADSNKADPSVLSGTGSHASYVVNSPLIRSSELLEHDPTSLIGGKKMSQIPGLGGSNGPSHPGTTGAIDTNEDEDNDAEIQQQVQVKEFRHALKVFVEFKKPENEEEVDLFIDYLKQAINTINQLSGLSNKEEVGGEEEVVVEVNVDNMLHDNVDAVQSASEVVNEAVDTFHSALLALVGPEHNRKGYYLAKWLTNIDEGMLNAKQIVADKILAVREAANQRNLGDSEDVVKEVDRVKEQVVRNVLFDKSFLVKQNLIALKEAKAFLDSNASIEKTDKLEESINNILRGLNYELISHLDDKLICTHLDEELEQFANTSLGEDNQGFKSQFVDIFGSAFEASMAILHGCDIAAVDYDSLSSKIKGILISK